MLSNDLKSHIKLHFIVFIWGFTSILGALISLDALALVWYRMVFALIMMYGYIFLKKIPLKIPSKKFIGFLIAGFIIAIHWFTFFRAIKVSNISVTLACLSSGAFFVSLLQPLVTKKRLVWYEVVFGLVVIAGLYIIFKVETNYVEGILLALTSALFSAIFSIVNEKYAKEYSAIVITFYELLGGVLFFTCFLLFNNSFNADFFIFQWKDLFYLLILSSFCTAYAFVSSVRIMKYLSAYTVMLTINLEPVYGIILAVLIFKEKEKMSSDFYIGAIVILVIVLLNTIIKKKNVQE